MREQRGLYEVSAKRACTSARRVAVRFAVRSTPFVPTNQKPATGQGREIHTPQRADPVLLTEASVKKVNIIVGALAVVLVVVFSFLANRPQPKPTYNVATETRMQGSVQQLEEFNCPVTEDRGLHFVLKTDDGPVMVHVGVSRKLRTKNIRFTVGDQVEVLGSKIRYQGSESIIAREITRGGETFILRDASGQSRLD